MKTLACLLAILCIAATSIERIPDGQGGSIAVVVPADFWPVHLRQRHGADAAKLLADIKRDSQHIVKINVVATDLGVANAAREAIRQRFAGEGQPAVSVVVGALPWEGATVAIDGIASYEFNMERSRLFISGQAEKGESPAAATASTATRLVETLKFAESTAGNAVQAKCFLTPVSAANQVLDAYHDLFPDPGVMAFVEWKSALPVEIEMVALGPEVAADAPPIEYLTPPGMTASPLFARVVRVNRSALIYIGDIYSKEAGTGEAQVLSIFDQLQAVLKQTGSDVRHLVKATYYVCDDDASKQLNVLRPRFYDPARPPAASKAMVPGVGMADRSISIDMIAVPATQPTPEPASTRRAESGRK